MEQQQVFVKLIEQIDQQILGQHELVQSLVVALLADGHLLVEGAPGLAKTRAIKTLSGFLKGGFNRIQFTPDLLPADVTGSEVFRPQTADFSFQPGPVFADLLLADEINRAPAKVQSALLEAMSERQVTIGKTTHTLSDIFLVMATQNPIEQEGTYPLPEAQLDRFLMHVNVDYPNAATERQILQLTRAEALSQNQPEISQIDPAHILAARKEILAMHVSDAVEEYMVQLTMATRQPEKYDDELARWIAFGVSPRATLALDRCARAFAYLQGRDYVNPDDVLSIFANVFRHRLILHYQALAAGVTSDKVIKRLAQLVPVA